MKKIIWINAVLKESLFKDGLYCFNIADSKFTSLINKVVWSKETIHEALESIDESQFESYTIEAKEPTKKEKTIESIDWDRLRDKFFKECTNLEHKESVGLVYIDMLPHDVFEWFKKNIQNI